MNKESENIINERMKEEKSAEIKNRFSQELNTSEFF